MKVRDSLSLRALLAAAALLATLLIPAAAGADNAPVDHFLLGAVPAHGPGALPAPAVGPPGPGGLPGPGPAGAANRAAGTSNNLTYHGGSVMRTNNTYAIFWTGPTGTSLSSTYQSNVSQFFKDVAAASGTTGNVYATDTQYSDTTGSIAYSSAFGGAYVDTTKFPTDPTCESQYASQHLTVNAGCFLDSELQNEVQKDITTAGWVPSANSEFFVFTPQNVGSCFYSSGNYCAYSYYCAYHSNIGTGSGQTIYANMPFPDSSQVFGDGTQDCSVGQSPNNNWSDAVINVTSHEHNEAITDPDGTAWYDNQGNEDGDKCAWNFGATSGPNGAEYNQTINGDHYFLQQEWSNASSGCALGYAPPGPPSITSVSPTQGAVGSAVTISGANFTGATSVKFDGTSAAFSVGSGGSTIATSVPSGAGNGTISVTTPYGTVTSTQSFTVLPTPDFTIAVAPSSLNVKRGTSGSYTVTITRGTGFTGSVSLQVSGLPGGPQGVNASFNPSTISSAGTTSTLTISARSNARTGTSTLTVTGTSGSLRHSATTSLTIS